MPGGIKYDKTVFAANLLRLMEQEREQQADIARLLGVSRATVCAYCSGTQMPRMDKLEQLSRHFGVRPAELIEDAQTDGESADDAPQNPALEIYDALNEAGQDKFVRYGRELLSDSRYRAAEAPGHIEYIKHFLVPAAAGYASPVEGEDYELTERTALTPLHADFSVDIQGDSMEPYIHDGETVYVRRGAALDEFDVGIFYVDGDVFCKQWCVDYTGTLHLLSANPRREDANIRIPRSANRSVVCFGKVLLPARPPKPVYY